MRGLKSTLLLLPLGLMLNSGCSLLKKKAEVGVRDELVVEQYRNRITKVRNAIEETRTVIARSRGAPYLTELNMRLAELLSEEARYHYMVAYEREGGKNAEALHVPQVRDLKLQSVSIYESILKRDPTSHLADRILFNISHEQRELGNFDEMIGALRRLIKGYRDSPLVTEAMLVLGDYHFDKFELQPAERYYTGIVMRRDPLLSGLAYYKLAWVQVNFGDCPSALTNFENAIKVQRAIRGKEEAAVSGRQPRVDPLFEIPETKGGGFQFAGHQTIDVEREALVDLTYCYAQEREPEKAAAFLRARASTREAYVASLRKMALRFAVIEQPVGAAEVTRELLRLGPDEEERLDDARMLHNVVTRMNDYTNVGEDTELILKAMRRRLLDPSLSNKSQKQLTREFESMARDLATRAQRALAGELPSSKEWTPKPSTSLETARAYQSYLAAVPTTSHRLDMVQNLADVLLDGSDFVRAGHRYREAADLLSKSDAAVAVDEPEVETKAATDDKEAASKTNVTKQRVLDQGERDRLRQDALYNAVVAYQKSLKSKQSDNPVFRATARAGLRQAGGNYLAESNPDRTRELRIKYAIAESYYNEGKYLEAVDLLTAIAFEFPGTENGDAAVNLVLDAYNTVNDISGLIAAGRLFMDSDKISANIRQGVGPILEAAEQRRLDELSLAASGDQAGGMEVLLTFAETYKGTDLGEKALLNTFVAARAAGSADQIYTVGEQLIRDFPNSDQTAGVATTLGQTAASRYEFTRALSYLDMAAKLNRDQGPALLLTAGGIREQLADHQGALKNYQDALRLAPEGPRRSAAAVAAADLLERVDGPKAIIRLLNPYAGDRDPEIASRLGLAYLRSGQIFEAEDQFRVVVEGAAGSTGAMARAHYGLAEVMLDTLAQFQPYDGLDAMEEAIGLIDITIQSYLAAARQPDPIYSQAALARLGSSTQAGIRALQSLRLPQELSPEERDMLNAALQQRMDGLKSGRDEAVAECAKRAQENHQIDGAGLSCLRGEAPVQDPIRFTPLASRAQTAELAGLEEVRDRLLKNPNDLDALRSLGSTALKAGDAHAARLALIQAMEAGGDYNDQNMLGVAHYQAGDRLGAMAAFGAAKDAGSGAAAYNLAALYTEVGLNEAAAELRSSASGTRGMLIGPAQGSDDGGKKK